MSNLPDPLYYDETGAGDTAALPLGTAYLRSVNGDTRYVVHDGQTVGGLPHVTRYPAAPISIFATAPAKVYADTIMNYWQGGTDNFVGSISGTTLTVTQVLNGAVVGGPIYGKGIAAGTTITAQTSGPQGGVGAYTVNTSQTVSSTRLTDGRFTPVAGQIGGTAKWGIPDPTLNQTVPWIWALQVRALYCEWKRSGSADAVNRLQSAWSGFKQGFTLPGDFTSTVYGTNKLFGLSDDAAWFAGALANIYDATQDPGALGYLIEVIAAANVIFADTKTPQTNPGVSTPGYGGSSPIAFKYGQHGMLYDQTVNSSYGYTSTSFELFMVSAALYAANQIATSNAALAIAFRQYASDFTNFWFANAKSAAPVDSNHAAAGIYWAAVIIDPANANYLKPYNSQFARPLRGATAHSLYGTIQMANMMAELRALVQSTAVPNAKTPAAYLAEFKSIVAAVTQPNGFGRNVNGKALLVNADDPWGAGSPFYEFVGWALQLRSGSDCDLVLSSVIDTAKNILAGGSRGYLTPEWVGLEYNNVFNTGSWEEECANASYGVNQASGEGRREQAMTHSASWMLLLAATQLVAFEAGPAYTGYSAPVSIEMLWAHIAALEAQVSVLSSPIYRWGKGSLTFFNPSDQAIRDVVAGTERFLVNNGGTYTTGDATVTGNLTANNLVATFLTKAGGNAQIYMGSIHGFPGYHFGPDDSYINYDVTNTTFKVGISSVENINFGKHPTTGNMYFGFAGTTSRIEFGAGGEFDLYIGNVKIAKFDGSGNLVLKGTLTPSGTP